MKKKIVITFILIVAILVNSLQFVFADRFWNLYKLGEARKNSGDLVGAISAWEEIVELYKYDSSKDGLTRSAVYWTKIAESYSDMGWFGEAQQAYKNVEHFWNILGEKDSAWGPNRIATRLKTHLDVYAQAPVDYNQNLAKFEPYSGLYFGAPFDKDPKIGTALEKVDDVYGKKHTAFLMYVRWGEPIQYWTANQAKELGAALQLAWEPPADMNTITYNEVVSFAKELRNLEIPIFLRFASEMNEISNPWSQNSPEVFKKVFKMVADIMHSEAPNVAMVWSPLYVPEDGITKFYPGDDAVDWVGINAYTDRYYIGDPNTRQLIEDLYYQGYYANPMDRFEYIYNLYSDRKPIMISETGVQNYAMNTGEDFSNWAENNIKRLYEYMPMKYPKIKGIYYFNVDSNLVPGLNLKQNYSLSRSSKVMNAYKDVINNPYYLSSVNTNADFQYKPLEQTTFNKNQNIKLSSYVKLIDPFINKVEYWIDGQKFDTVNEIPFETTVNFGDLSQGKHILRIDAYNSQNELSARRVYVVNVNNSKITFEAEDVQYIPKHKVLNDTNGHWAKGQIEELVSLWSIDGYDDGTFKPERKITRAEFYKLLSTALGMGLEVNTNEFVDVAYGHWAKQLIDGGVQLGILEKDEYKGGFSADDPITRAELAMWAVRALNGGQDVVSQNTEFTDNNKISEKYRGYINEAYKIGIIDGFPDKTFRANESATRAQAVSMVIRVVHYQQNK